MTKYLIEGNLNFYEELYKSLCEENKSDDYNCCLITEQPLVENYITMECGHKFNYQPLFYDILNHKKKYNSMERQHLRSCDIRCPYCRNVQKKLLPHVEGYPKVHGVNYYEENPSKVLHNSKMCKLVSDGYIIGECCYEMPKTTQGEQLKCTTNMVKMLSNNKFYCHYHMYLMVKKAVLENKLKLKEEKKKAKEQEKIKLKEEKKKAKEAEKIKKLQEKMNLKKSKSSSVVVTNLDENTVITNETVIGCTQLLKTGERKGLPCNCKVFTDGMCQRHYNLSKKTTTKIIDLTNDDQ